MNLIQQTIIAALPSKHKKTPSGWTSFNAPCCVHNGESADNRLRGGIMQNSDGTVSYHCFNCNYTASYVPGRNLNYKMRKLLAWLLVPNDVITKCSLEALRIKEIESDQDSDVEETKIVMKEKDLPVGARPIMDCADWMALEPTGLDPDLMRAVEYIVDRGLMVDDYNFMWTPEGSYKSRLIIPFYHNGDVVGYTARKVGGGSPKYITDSQPGYVFNLDKQNWDRKYCIVVEGPLDAISVDGVAVLSNDVKDQQAVQINALRKNVIVVPDSDKAGADLVESALHYGWNVSFPDWPGDVKDVNQATRLYGKIYTMKKIMAGLETNKVKIEIKAKSYFND